MIAISRYFLWSTLHHYRSADSILAPEGSAKRSRSIAKKNVSLPLRWRRYVVICPNSHPTINPSTRRQQIIQFVMFRYGLGYRLISFTICNHCRCQMLHPFQYRYIFRRRVNTRRYSFDSIWGGGRGGWGGGGGGGGGGVARTDFDAFYDPSINYRDRAPTVLMSMAYLHRLLYRTVGAWTR